MIAEAGHIPGATVAGHDQLLRAVDDWPRHQANVTLCACPARCRAARDPASAGGRLSASRVTRRMTSELARFTPESSADPPADRA
jgi:hypothetical protein